MRPPSRATPFRSALFGVSLLALGCASAYAQDARRPRPQEASVPESVLLDEVVVDGAAGQPPATGTVGQPPAPYAGGQVATGARLGALGNRSILETPFNVVSFTEQLIRNQQARTLADVVLNDPSVRNDAPAFSERDAFFIRGFSVTNLDTAYDGLFYIANPRRQFLEGIERVEILKGPTALLNGGVGRVGGTINLIPKRAPDEPLNRLTTTYLSDSQVWPHFDVARRYGEGGEWGIRVNGSYRAGDTPLDRNENEVVVGALGLDYSGERLRASLDLNHSDQKIDAPISLFNAAAPGIPIPRAPDGRINTANSFEYIDSVYDMAAGRVEFDVLENTTVYAAGGASRYREDFLTSSYLINDVAGNATGTLAIQPQQIEGRTGEVGVRSRFETGFVGHQLNVSVSRAINENYRGGFPRITLPTFRTNIYEPSFLPASRVGSFDFPLASGRPLFADLLLTSLAVSDTLSVAEERFQLTLGGRYQDIRSRGFSTVVGPTLGDQTYNYEDSRFSPAVGAVVRLTEHFSVYGNYIEALTEGPTAPATALNASEVFAPVVSEQKEVGIKYDFGSFGFTTSLFQIEQPSGFTDPASRLFSVDGLQSNRGAEFTVFGEIVEGVRLLGGLTLIEAELEKTAGGRFDGNSVPGVPKVAFNLYGEYDVDWLAPGLTVTGRMLHTGGTRYDQANTQRVEDWTRFDLGARYGFVGPYDKPVEVTFNVENVFNESYWASSARGFLAAGAPRTFLVSASIDF
ncbi:TonB-dependent receptor [Aureimonas jatrophae]|uniref:Iron complex outermembrane recepter protein n=1 Tax=Aureimonas jatrophae TaxID=1166073 RepID=A0A1H0N591_9HYPH|nr:TonB-dependent receptor [Aureimonas jatrophae]MBB3953050.1 iron complex outermembrane receptor protein [Aureimonas jatrophae]SDO87867.1 iron complex outermembrane recepter protein [Aureimonas jatrophae]